MPAKLNWNTSFNFSFHCARKAVCNTMRYNYITIIYVNFYLFFCTDACTLSVCPFQSVRNGVAEMRFSQLTYKLDSQTFCEDSLFYISSTAYLYNSLCYLCMLSSLFYYLNILKYDREKCIFYEA